MLVETWMIETVGKDVGITVHQSGLVGFGCGPQTILYNQLIGLLVCTSLYNATIYSLSQTVMVRDLLITLSLACVKFMW